MITCWFTRQSISRCLDGGVALSDQAQRHINHCAHCHTHYQQQQLLVSRLSQEAQCDDLASSPFLRGKIVAAVRRAATPEPVTQPTMGVSWTGGLAFSLLAALVVAIVIQWQQPSAPPSSELLASVLEFSGEQVLEEATGQTFEELTVALNKPLETEMEFVMNDARMAIDSLASGFLPKSFLPAHLATPQ